MNRKYRFGDIVREEGTGTEWVDIVLCYSIDHAVTHFTFGHAVPEELLGGNVTPWTYCIGFDELEDVRLLSRVEHEGTV
jgi:hypothetical protein